MAGVRDHAGDERVEIRFTIPGPPVPKARARVFEDRRGKIRAITPARVRKWEEEIGWAFRSAYAGAPLDGPVEVALSIYEPPTAHPADLDNYVKAILDALNGIAWRDDRQVCELWAKIRRGEEFAAARVDVLIAPLAIV